MKGWLILRNGFIGLALAVLVAMPAGAHAQEEPESSSVSGMGFGGGQMVRGMVTSTSGDHLAIKTDQGEIFQVTVTTNTRMMKDRQPVRVADLKVGDSVGAMGVLDAPTKTVHAVMVMVVDAEQARKMREGLGKVYITGKVTAIDADNLKLTILRSDGVSQVIAVDEGTSFKRGGRPMQAFLNGSGPVPLASGAPNGRSGGGASPEGESITLADIKVGDGVAGQGELKGGVFVPKELGVMDLSRQRRRRPEGVGASPSATPPEQW